MKWSEVQMDARFQEFDAPCNEILWVGVLTTGIYCLPSCHARKALRKNVRFFRSVESASAAKLRPCQQCDPDDFGMGIDPLLEQIETLAWRRGKIRGFSPARLPWCAEAGSVPRGWSNSFGNTSMSHPASFFCKVGWERPGDT